MDNSWTEERYSSEKLFAMNSSTCSSDNVLRFKTGYTNAVYLPMSDISSMSHSSI